jgi:hypothetical protein
MAAPPPSAAQTRIVDIRRSTITIQPGKEGLFSAAGHGHWVSAPTRNPWERMLLGVFRGLDCQSHSCGSKRPKRTFADGRQKCGITEVSIARKPEDLMRIQFVASRQAVSGVK